LQKQLFSLGELLVELEEALGMEEEGVDHIFALVSFEQPDKFVVSLQLLQRVLARVL